jgi:hypothetical protein
MLWRLAGTSVDDRRHATCLTPVHRSDVIVEGEQMIVTAGAGISRWFDLVRREYEEMPGLSLPKSQMQRMWGMDATVYDVLIEGLVLARIVRKTRRDNYVAFRSAA